MHSLHSRVVQGGAEQGRVGQGRVGQGRLRQGRLGEGQMRQLSTGGLLESTKTDSACTVKTVQATAWGGGRGVYVRHA